MSVELLVLQYKALFSLLPIPLDNNTDFLNENVVDIFMMMYWPVSAQVVSGCVGPERVITGFRSATLGHWRRTMARVDNSNIQLGHIGHITVNGEVTVSIFPNQRDADMPNQDKRTCVYKNVQIIFLNWEAHNVGCYCCFAIYI